MPSKRGGRLPSSRARGAEMAIAEGGGVSPGAEERGIKGIQVVTRRAVEKMVVMPGTWSLTKHFMWSLKHTNVDPKKIIIPHSQ